MRLSPNWPATTLGDVLDFIGNGTTAEQNKDGAGLPVTRIETIASDYVDASRVGYIANPTSELVNRYRISAGDILFSHINSEPQIGRAVVYGGVPPVLLHGMNLLLLRFKADIADSQFMAYLFRHYRECGVFVGLASRAVGQSSINQGRLKTLQIRLPELAEQRAIAHILQTVEVAKQARQSELGLERERKAALMEHLFTFGTRGESTKQTEVGVIPQSWRVAELSELGEIVTGTTPRTEVKEYYGGPFLFVAPGDISDSPYVENSAKHLSEKGLGVSRELPKNTVLVVCIGATIGKVAMTATERSATNQQINAVIPNENVLPEFLYYALRFRSPELPNLASRTAVPIINKSVFSQFQVSVAEKDEQLRIADALGACDRKITALIKEMSSLDELFESALEELMTGSRTPQPRITDESQVQ